MVRILQQDNKVPKSVLQFRLWVCVRPVQMEKNKIRVISLRGKNPAAACGMRSHRSEWGRTPRRRQHCSHFERFEDEAPTDTVAGTCGNKNCKVGECRSINIYDEFGGRGQWGSIGKSTIVIGLSHLQRELRTHYMRGPPGAFLPLLAQLGALCRHGLSAKTAIHQLHPQGRRLSASCQCPRSYTPSLKRNSTGIRSWGMCSLTCVCNWRALPRLRLAAPETGRFLEARGVQGCSCIGPKPLEPQPGFLRPTWPMFPISPKPYTP